MTEPTTSSLQVSLAAAAQATRSGDHAAARRTYESLLRAMPQSQDLLLELAACCHRMHDFTSALAHANRVTDTRLADRAAVLRGQIHQQQGELDSAADNYELALHSPQSTDVTRAVLAGVLADLALNHFGDPSSARQLLTTGSAAPTAKSREAALIADLYLGGQDRIHLAAAFRQHAAAHIASSERLPQRPAKRAPRGGRLRIGLISPSFSATPVGFLTLGALELLAKQADLVFFDRQPKQDWLAAEFRRIAHSWIEVPGLISADLAQRIRQEDLDALIDCSGWTDVGAMTALSMRPCSRQFKWVGGQALTTGLDCFDGFLADQWQLPKASQSLYSEPILRFRDDYVTYVPPPYFDFFAAQSTAATHRQSARTQTYALVSNPAKISAATIAFVHSLKPKKLLLIDSRWRHARTRATHLPALSQAASAVEFITPRSHRDYLETLRDVPATFINTQPYSMGLTAIELLLIGRKIVSAPAPANGLMCERHYHGHSQATRFDHHQDTAQQLLRWCSGALD